MRESALERKLVNAVKGIGGVAPKWVSPGNNGVPDRIIILPQGRVTFIEMKAPGEELRPLQVFWQNRLLSMGHDARMIDSLNGIEQFIKDCRK